MKRSKAIREIKRIIATCGPTQPTIDTATQVLDRLEKLGIRYTFENEIYPWEPEQGWDKHFEEQDEKDQARDFKIVPVVNEYTKQEYNPRYNEISQLFLDGMSFEDLAKKYDVTNERIRQCVCRARRRYQKLLDDTNET